MSGLVGPSLHGLLIHECLFTNLEAGLVVLDFVGRQVETGRVARLWLADQHILLIDTLCGKGDLLFPMPRRRIIIGNNDALDPDRLIKRLLPA